MNDNYVRFDLYWEDPINDILLQSGKYIFRDNKLQLYGAGVIYDILHFVTNYNLADLELFLRLNGFCAFSNEEMMDEYSHAYTIQLNKNNNIAHSHEREKAIYEIKSTFGNNCIERYRNFKILQYEKEIKELNEKVNTLREEEDKVDKNLILIL